MTKILNLLFILFLAASCSQDSSDSGGGGLFQADDTKVANKFAITLADAKTYVLGENIDFTLIHAANIQVEGSPRLRLNVGGTTRYANYLAGDNTRNVIFRYTVQAGDNDLDGIDLNSTVELNGGKLDYAELGVLKAANLKLGPVNANGIKIKTEGPSIIAVSTPASDEFNTADVIAVEVTFDEDVAVSGTPLIELTSDSGNVDLSYVSGSGSDKLLFEYEVAALDYDNNGLSLDNAINLNSGSIQGQLSALAANLDFTSLNPDLSGKTINTGIYQLAYTTQPSNTHKEPLSLLVSRLRFRIFKETWWTPPTR